MLNGDAGRPGRTSTATGSRWTAWPQSNELRVAADCAYSRTGEGLHRFTDPADGGVYLYSDLETFDAHRIYACFDQPDLKATFELDGHGPAGLAGDLEHGARRRRTSRRRAAPAAGTSRPRRCMSDLHHRDRGRPVPRGPRRARRHPARHLLPPVAGQLPGPGRDLRGDPAGLRLLPRRLRRAVPVRQVRPAVRARVQGRRDGERRLRHVPRGLRVPVPGHRLRPGVPRRDDPARDGAHVVRRPGHHALVGRPVAERVVRHLGRHRWPRPRPPAGPRAWTTFAQPAKAWAYRQDQLPSTHPIAADIPDIEAVEVNFDGITYAKGAAVLKQLVAYVGRDNFLAGVRRYFGQHAWGNATLGDLLAAAGGDLGPGPVRLVEGVAGDRRGEHAAAGVPVRRRRTGSPRSRCSQEAPPSHPVLRPHRIAIGLYDRTRGPGLTRRRRVEIDIDGERTEVPELAGERPARPGAGQRRRPDLRQDPAGRPLAAHADQRHRRVHRVAARRAVLGRRLGHVPGRGDWPRATTCAWCCPASDAIEDIIGGADACCARPRAAVRRFADPAWRGRRAGADRRRAARPAAPGRARLGPPARLRAGAGRRGHRRPATWRCWPGCSTARRTMEGLAVDTELRWQLLHRLVSRGAAGPAEIDAELAGTPPTRASGTPPPAGPRSRPPRPRRRPGRRSSAARCRTRRSARRWTASPTRTSRGTARAVRGAVLRRGRRHLARLELGHGPVLRRVRLPVVARSRRRPSPRPTTTSSGPARRRRCAGC